MTGKMNHKVLSLIVAMVLATSSFAASIATDHTWYLAGETMTVSVTANDALIAYAELCDTYGLATGVAIGLKGGEGTGILQLPSDLHSGYYVLSVYTRHDTHVAHRLVAVVNPLHKSEDDDIEWVKIAHPDSLSFSVHEQAQLEFTSVKTVDERETEGHIIKARVKNVYNGNSFHDNDILTSLSIVGKQIHYFEGKMVNDSIAIFYTYGIHGKHPLVLSAKSSTGVSLPVEIISPFATILPKRLPHLVFHYQRREVEARSMNLQQQLKLRADASVGIAPLDYDETVFGTKPELTYNLDEYRQFLTIKEVLLEYVSCIKKTKINGVTQLIVRKEEEPYHSFLPSLVLIDGMPVSDTERLLYYDARRIHYINVYGGQYTFGNGIYNGILSFITRSGQLTNYPTERNMQYLVYEFP